MELGKSIANQLDNVPLAIEQAGALIHSGMSIYDFAQAYASQYQKLMREKPAKSEWCYDKNRSVFNTFQMLVENKNLRDDNMNRRLLTLISFLGPGEVSLCIFTKEPNSRAPIAESGRGEAPSGLPAATVALDLLKWYGCVTEKNNLDLRLAILRLEKFCLVRSRKALTGKITGLSVHDAIRRWIIENLDKASLKAWTIFAASVACMILSENEGGADASLYDRSISRQIHNTFLMMCSKIPQGSVRYDDGILFEQYGIIMIKLAHHFMKTHKESEAEEAVKRAIEHQMVIQGTDWPRNEQSFMLIELLGDIYWKSSRFEEAQDVFEDLLESSTEGLGNDADFTVNVSIKLKKVQERMAAGRAATERVMNASLQPKRRNTLQTTPEYSRPGNAGNFTERENEEISWLAATSDLHGAPGTDEADWLSSVFDLGAFYEQYGMWSEAILQYIRLWSTVGKGEAGDAAAKSMTHQGLRFQALLGLMRCHQSAGTLIKASEYLLVFPLYSALYHNFRPVLDYLRDLIDEDFEGKFVGELLHGALREGCPSLAKELIYMNVDVDFKSLARNRECLGRTPLQCTAVDGYIEVAKLLLDRGADPTVFDDKEGTPLHSAAGKGHVDVVQLLLENGAEVNAQGGAYGKALQAASTRGHEKVVQLLLEKGAEVNARGGKYGNALKAASSKGHEKVVQLLLEKGAM